MDLATVCNVLVPSQLNCRAIDMELLPQKPVQKCQLFRMASVWILIYGTRNPKVVSFSDNHSS